MPQALKRSEGCWAWVVLLASVVTQGLTLGFPTCIGIFFTELQREFQASNSETSWFPSILTAMLHAGGEQDGEGLGVGWDAGRYEEEPWGEGRQPQPLWPPGSLSLATGFAWCCEFLGCHLDFSRASSPAQDPVGLGWVVLGQGGAPGREAPKM